MTNQSGYLGTATDESTGSEFNALSFLINQILSHRCVAQLVKIVAVTSAGDLAVAGLVDVLPLVGQLDGEGNEIPHAVIHGLIYSRIQGGANAIIMDPQIGDIGMAVFADRDISAVKATRAAANPGSMRRNDMADGMYIGGLLNGVPTQFVQFNASGIKIVSPTKVEIVAPSIVSSGAWAHAGTLTNNGKNIGSTHTHGGVSSGGSNTAGPN